VGLVDSNSYQETRRLTLQMPSVLAGGAEYSRLCGLLEAPQARCVVSGSAAPYVAGLRAYVSRPVEGLTPVEEKLIALNSCYGFITRYSISDGHRQGITYPRHVKGHITVFPNNVQELVKNVLPHPLLKVLDDIHVSWQGQGKTGAKRSVGVIIGAAESSQESAAVAEEA
jgi:hypothetical protein